MNKTRGKIEERLSSLEDALKNNKHIEGQESLAEIHTLIAQVAKFWSILNGEQRDFINAARFATEDQLKWK